MGGAESPKPQPLQGFGISVTTALNGIPRAVIFGTNRLNGNVIDYVDFTATQQGGGGKGGKGGGKGITGGLKGQNGQFTYTVTLDVGICVGPVQGVGDVWETTSSPVSIPNLGSGATVFDGTDGQGPWSYMTSTHPDRAIGYNGLAHVAVPNMNLGSSPSLPNLTFEMLGLGIAASINPWAPKKGAKAWTTTYTPLSGLSGPFATIAGIVKPPATVQNDVVFDTSPAWCIAAVLTDTQFGCGFDQSLIGDLTDFTTWCQAQGIFFSPIMVSQREARSYLQDWFKACLADPYWSEGKIKIGIYADQPVTGTAADGSSLTFTPNTTSVMSIDDTVMLPGQSKDEGPLTVTRKDPADIANVIVVDYHERDYGYNDLPARVTDEALIADYGYHPGPNITGDFITQGAVAQRVADLLLARETGNLETYDWRMGGLAALLEPFDIVDLNDEAMGMSSYPARMLSIEEEDDTVFHCQAEEVPGLVGGMVERPVAVAAGATSTANAAPGNVNTPFFFEPPSALTQAGSGLELWAFLSGQDLADWGGCQINISTDGNTYTSVLPSQIGAARMGVSTTALASVSQAASGPTYDTVNTITVDLSESGGELLSTDQAGALALNTLCVVDEELISYTTATLISENVYQLSGLVRGAYGTDIAAHSAGAQFARVDGIQFRYPFTADRIGQTINFKFLSFNQFGANPQDLDQVSAFSYALQGAALSYAPGNVTGLTTVFSAGQTLLQWTAVPDPRAIDYEYRLGTNFATAQVLGRTPLTQAPILGDGTYWVVAHYQVPNGSDVYSETPASVTITGSTLTSNVIATRDQSAEGWLGTFTNTALVTLGPDKVLSLVGSGDILTDPDITATPDIIYYGGVVNTGSYQIPASDRIILAAPRPCNAMITLGAVVGYDLNAVDITQVSDMTQLTDVLGVETGNKAWAQPQIRLSQDGGVTWGSWQNWIPGAYVGSGFDFRVILNTNSPQIAAVLTNFVPAVDVPDLDQDGNVSVGTGGTSVTFTTPYNGGNGAGNTPTLQCTVIGGAQGDTVLITGLSKTGFTVQVVNGGSGVARTVHWQSQGF